MANLYRNNNEAVKEMVPSRNKISFATFARRAPLNEMILQEFVSIGAGRNLQRSQVKPCSIASKRPRIAT